MSPHPIPFVVALVLLSWPASASPPDKSSVKANKISLPSGPGSIEGLGESFEPQLNTGASSYGVKIALPPGRAGLEPSVRLAYNSGLGNSIVGIGWTMEFLSIKRQTDKGFPSYADTDTFLLGGEELVPLNDETYRCENESGFQRVQRVDRDGDGAQEWEVTDRNGTRHILGQYAGNAGRWSAVTRPGAALTPATRFQNTFCWMVNVSIDLHGNRIEYDYLPGTGVLYPNSITWGHAGAVYHEVGFLYETRADAFDDYRPTFSALIDQRLRRIEVRSQGNAVRSYELRYDYAPGDLTPAGVDLGVSVLKGVTQYDRTGGSTLPPLRFFYAPLNLSGAAAREIHDRPSLDLAEAAGTVQIADVNGDGLPDVFSNRAYGPARQQEVCLNRGPAAPDGVPRFAAGIPAMNPSIPALDLDTVETSLTDMDGDGLTDLVRIEDGGPAGKWLKIYPNRSSLGSNNNAPGSLGFATEPKRGGDFINGAGDTLTFASATTRQIDLNFDKVPDFLATVTGSFLVMRFQAFYRDSGTGQWVDTEFFGPASFPAGLTFDNGLGGTNPAVHLADMNGDRLLDLVHLDADSFGGFEIHYWPYCALGQWAEKRTITFAPGDALPARSWSNVITDFFIQDFTGDGLADVLFMDGAGVQSALSLWVNVGGAKWAPRFDKGGLPRYTPNDAGGATTFRTADLNGNGTTDLLWRNTAIGQDRYDWLEFMPGTKANLMTKIDNSLGKITHIEYGSSTDDMVRAADQVPPQPWTTKTPFPVQVVRRLISTCSQDLDGRPGIDHQVSELHYRDAFYDALEREFRGFAYAERVDYGDDFSFDPDTGIISPSTGWNTGVTPTGQVSAPSRITRYRFLTGAPDRMDNDDYAAANPPANALRDEYTLEGGREEEILKGRQVWEEKIDPWVLHSQDAHAGFDEGAWRAATQGTDRLTPDDFVYSRIRQDWTVRRLYRPAEDLTWIADQDQNGEPEDYGSAPPVPAGRFDLKVMPDTGKSVSFAFASWVVTEVRDANGLLSQHLTTPDISFPVHPPVITRSTFDYDDYGNETVQRDFGVDGVGPDDERFTTTTYALDGDAKFLWIIGQPDTVTVTDENGALVSKTIHYYDGVPFVGVQGQITDRALLHRTQEFKTATTAIEATRTRYDASGNPVELRDPIGNTRTVAYDAAFRIYPVTETIVVGGGNPDLTVSATYDTGFGTVTSSTDFNNNLTEYQYDSFARLVKIIRPGDTLSSPTLAFEYQPADPTRSQLYTYDPAGNLTLDPNAPERSASRVLTRQREIAGGSEFITAAFTDGCGKKLGTVEEGETAGTWIVKAATSYNLRGAAQSTWLPYQISSAAVPQFGHLWTAAGRPPVTDGINPAITATDHFYDATGREIRSVNPPETWEANAPRKFTAVQYLPFEERHFDEEDTDPASIHTNTPMVHYKDGLGRLTGVDEVVKTTDTGDPGPLAAWQTRYLYDLNDQLRRITDSQGNVKTMDFDGLKRMTGMNDPDRGVMTFLYDDASNLKETLDAKNQRIAYTYDGANRIKTEDYQDGGPRVFDVEYFYDAPLPGGLAVGELFPAIAENTRGQLAYVHDLSGETHFSYDTRARVISEIKRFPDRLTGQLVNFRTRFGNDSADRLQTLTYPDGDQLQHAYNPRNLLTRLYGATLGDIVQSIAYQPSGQLSGITYGNTVASAYQYDPRLRLASLNSVSQPSTLNSQLLSYSYTFDGASNITRIDDRRDLTAAPQAAERFNTQAFTYDSLYRLTRVDYPGLGAGAAAHYVEYRYDRIGNMLRQTSDLTHQENGLPVANLGAMESGGSPTGNHDRQGRAPNDPPGPHALTVISNQSASNQSRSYNYDANGNMLTIDGLTCMWDFKDRLIATENATMRATYAYDYTDRRITKTVVEKLPSTLGRGAGGEGLFTAYVNKYFELREGDSPVKYVWNGDTRVARVTATLSSTLRTQHLRLRPGWNLVCLTVGGPQPRLDPATNPTIPAALVWSSTTPGNGYTALTGTTPITSGTSVWIWSTTAQTLLLTGTAPPATVPALTGTGQFIGNLLPERLDLGTAFPATAWLTRYEPAAGPSIPGKWLNRFPLGHDLAPLSDTPAWLNPGEALWTTQGSPANLNLPAAALSIRYYHQDHLGSTSVITDQSGSLVEETTNYAFGHPRNSYKPGPVLPEAYGFTQKERDGESGLHYFEARYQKGELARFLTSDQLLLSAPDQALPKPQMANVYAYSLNSPIRFVDPSGFSPSQSQATAFGLDIDPNRTPFADWVQEKANWHFKNAMDAGDRGGKGYDSAIGLGSILIGSSIEATKDIFVTSLEKSLRTGFSPKTTNQQKLKASGSLAWDFFGGRALKLLNKVDRLVKLPSMRSTFSKGVGATYKQAKFWLTGNRLNQSSIFRSNQKAIEIFDRGKDAMEYMEQAAEKGVSAIEKHLDAQNGDLTPTSTQSSDDR